MNKKVQFLKSHLVPQSGYGELARNLAGALLKAGWEILVVENSPEPFEMAGIQYTPQNQKDIPIIYITYHHNLYAPEPGQPSIMRTMMETHRLNPRWVKKLGRADALWVPSHFNRDTFAASGLDAQRIFVVRDPVDTQAVSKTPYPLKTQKKYVFLSIFNAVTWYRKGVDVLIKGYLKAFNRKDDVCLAIKTNCTYDQLLKIAGLEPHEGFPEIEIIDAHLTDDEMSGLYAAADAYVMPSRGEGIGRPYLYAMLNRLPTIATGWSGNTEFMNRDNSFLLRYTLKANPWELGKIVTPLNYGLKYAEPDIPHLAGTMRFIYKNQDLARAKGAAARKEILKNHSYDAVVQQVEEAFSLVKKNPAPPQPLDIFESMYPLYFPGVTEDIAEADNRFTQKMAPGKVRKVAIYGTGEGGQLAYQWLKRFKEIQEVVFLDRQEEKRTFLGHDVVFYKEFDSKKFDLILVATATFFVPQILENLKKHTAIPIYFFGP